MASTLTRRNAEVSLKALSLGAADYIPKPATNREVTTSASFRRDLIEKIRQLGGRRKRGAETRARAPAAPPARAGGLARPKIALAETRAAAPAYGHATDFKLRPFAITPPRVLLIGSSTGGPQALTALVARDRAGARPRAGADHAAHAADLHDHSGRASRARERLHRRTRPKTARRSCPARSISRPAAAT